MIGAGFHYLDDSDGEAPLSSATFLDVAGAGAGMRSPERLVRLFFKGRPAPAELAPRVAEWHARGCRIQLGNEPNLPVEEFGGGPDDYALWFARVADLAPAGARLYYAGMSPGLPGWQDWYDSDLARSAIERASGLSVHAYGTLDQIKATVGWIAQQFPGKPIWLSEFNFGAGQAVDRDGWAEATVGPLLDWLETIPAVEAASYFAYRWPTPDMHLPTPVDAIGSRVEQVIRAWRPTRVERHEERTVATSNPWAGKIAIVWNLPADVSGMIALGRQLGLDGFDFKIADGNSSWAGRRVTRDRVDALKQAGFRVLGWSYNYCDGRRNAGDRGDGVPEEEADAALQAISALGLDGWASDLEIECEGRADGVATLLDRVRAGTNVPISAYTWADLKGHDTYPSDVIATRVDVLRPMVYRPVWNAPVCWPCWAHFGKPICPAWGVTEATLADLGVDFAFADAHKIVGESYWELEALTNRRAELAPLVTPRLRPAPEPRPEPAPEPGQPTLDDMEQNAWGPAWRAKEYLRTAVGTPVAQNVADIIERAILIHKQSVGAP